MKTDISIGNGEFAILFSWGTDVELKQMPFEGPRARILNAQLKEGDKSRDLKQLIL